MATLDRIEIRRVDDMHVHLRQGEMLKNVLPYTAGQCARALVMPNTTPPVLTAEDLNRYRSEILAELETGRDFEPLMTFKVVPALKVDEVEKLKQAGAVAGKLYPEGVTTNSADGVKDFKELYPVYEAMEREDLVLCIHGEVPGVFSLDRESAFLSTLKEIVRDFPKLRVVLEHATTREAVELVGSMSEYVAATLTLHHLYLTLDDVIGGGLSPHAFCKPVAKLPSDRKALLDAAFSGDPKFFLGSDSAPHLISAKENACGAAGVYTAPVLLPSLLQLFEEHGKLDRFEAFVSEYGARFYKLPLNQGKMVFVRKEWQVPEECAGVKPFMAGEKLHWKVLD